MPGDTVIAGSPRPLLDCRNAPQAAVARARERHTRQSATGSTRGESVWQGIEGHDGVVERFRRAVARGRLSGSYLFIGPEGVGKRSFALKLAETLLCLGRSSSEFAPCGRCDACLRVEAGTHPDLDVVAKPPDKSSLPLELLIGDDQHRGREGLCYRLALRPVLGGRKIAIIDDADFLRVEAANCLLKTIEEPPPGSVLILIGTSLAKQLPTIRSRCQVVRFGPLAPEIVSRLLVERGLVAQPGEAERLARHGQGSLARAAELADSALWQFRDELLGRLPRLGSQSGELAAAIGEFVAKAGKSAAARRGRLRMVIGFAMEYYRDLLRRQSRVAPAAHVPPPRAAAEAGGEPNLGRTAAMIERCLDALDQIDRNVHQAVLIECWIDDLALLAAG